jgi:hypothetical protein
MLNESEANRTVCNNTIKSIGIISFDEITKWIDVKSEVEQIFTNCSVEIYNFRPHSKKNKPSSIHFSEKSFGWKAQIKNNNLKKFLEYPFDLLIGYFNKNNLYTELAVLQSKATFKAGISLVNQQLYDIEIKEYPKNTERFLLELKKYLTILNKI